MLFNSYAFLFGFLPLVLLGYAACVRWQPRAANGWLAIASLYFYADWNWRYLPLLLASIGFNFYCAKRIAQSARHWLYIGVLSNLALLLYFKYANFLLEVGTTLLDQPAPLWQQVLPIGISFFTFTQLAYLLDSAAGRAGTYTLIDYTLFVSYFPHLIAGPVLHHAEMMPQFARRRGLAAECMAPAIAIFVFGLSKKVLLADPLIPLVSAVFAPHATPTLIEAWVGLFAYSMQLYFDFSGYSDMAIGLSLLLGIQLPWNFNSPYKALNIAMFWRCWHMTLSRFLRDYLYLPLGGRRRRHYRNLLLTMLLGGLWHGAGWNFIIWGAMHGSMLMGYQLWLRWQLCTLSPIGARTVTFLGVMLAWVMFRAPDLSTAAELYRGLAGFNGLSLPHGLAQWADYLPQGLNFDGLRLVALEGGSLPTLMLAALLAFGAPNTAQLFQPGLSLHGSASPAQTRPWRSGPVWASLCAGLFLSCLFNLQRVSEFLYFQF